jgi:phosphoribosyl 1,2-cyclic phosphodiesterase
MPVLNIIASGSSGNSYCIETETKFIFVDVGVSCKTIESILNKNLKSKEVYLFITHEHRDHIAGYKTFQKRYSPKVFCSEGTATAMYDSGFNIDNAYILRSCENYILDDFEMTSFDIHHDASEPLGYKFYFSGKSITFATDLGIVDKLVLDYLSKTDLIILEANYEDKILKNGKYPEFLKKRILSSRGHLSNKDALNTIGIIADTGISEIYLSHISDENNDYKLVKKYADFIEEHYSIKTGFICRGSSKKDIKI